MRGAATAELLRCAEPLRSVGAVDCDSNTTMVAHRGTLDCATSLSSSTADLQRRTWGMHCARALVSGFAGAASAPWLALAHEPLHPPPSPGAVLERVCTHARSPSTSAIAQIAPRSANSALSRGLKQRTRTAYPVSCRSRLQSPADRPRRSVKPTGNLSLLHRASARGHGVPHIIFGVWWALIKRIREELNPDRCRSGADYIRNHKARRGLASKGGLRRPSLQGARQR